MTHPDYFEGVLQLRNPSNALIDFIMNQIKKAKTVTIAKAVPQPRGVDYYISSQKFLRQLARILPRNFPGILKSTRKLFTRKRITSKNVYRVNILFRMVAFKKGDVLTLRGTEYKVLVMGKQVTLQDVKTGVKLRKSMESLAS